MTRAFQRAQARSLQMVPIWTRRAAAGAWRHFFGFALATGEEGKELEIPEALVESAFPKPREHMREVGFPPALVVVNPVDPLRDEGDCSGDWPS